MDNVDLKDFGKKYGLYIGAGLVLFYLAYSYLNAGTSSSSTSTTGGLSSTDYATLAAASLNSQTQLQLAQIQANGAAAVAQINADATNQEYGTLAGAQAYGQNIAATQSVANTAIAATASENIAGYNALATGFTNYVVGSANEIATAAAATGNIANSNNATGQQVAQDITAIASLVSAAEGGGVGLGSYFGGAQYNMMGGLQTIPIAVGSPNTIYPNGSAPAGVP